MRVALCVIATNDYIDFTPPLLTSAEKYFLIGHEVHYHIFTNCSYSFDVKRLSFHEIEHEPWPAMTLKRYHIMSGADLSGYDYVYYIDADMLFVAPVGDEIFGELVGVQHPGFYRGGGSWETNMRSEAYVFPQDRKKYLAGGFQGGTRYYNFCTYLKEGIDNDTFKGVTAVWHDESHWNSCYSLIPEHFTILDPSYCMVEEPEKRKAWGIDHLEPKIIALKKDHKKYQK
jgi:histo-blood group ABO system transferase